MDDAEHAAGPRATRGMSGKDLLRGSAFHLSEGEADEGGAFTFWGRMAVGGFEAQADGVKLESDVTTGVLGIDGEWGDVLVGVAVARSESEGSYRQVVSDSGGTDRGKIESDLDSIYPYTRVALGEGLSAWGLVGLGTGGLTVRSQDQASVETKIAMQMGAFGVKGRVFADEDTDGLRLSVKSDAMWARTRSEAAKDLDEAKGDASRVRLILDAERDFDAGLGSGATLTPSGEIGLRLDGGDAVTGAGMELGAGLRFVAGAFTLESRLRVLAVHEAIGHKEWGASTTLAMSPDTLGRGLSFSFRPVWGGAESGTGALWSQADARDPGAGRGSEAKGRLDARLGYGFGAFGDRLTATPEFGMGIAGSHRRYSLGWRLERPWRGRRGFDLLFEATRRETTGEDRPPEHGVGVTLKADW